MWQKSAQFEREAGALAAEEALLIEGTARYPGAPKLWMMLLQLYERAACSASVQLWRLAVRLEEAMGGVARARSMLEAARLRIPKSPELWTESVRLERRAGNAKLADSLMARALQVCPRSGGGGK